MTRIYLLPAEERELFFRTAADTLKISFDIIEKDYWVVWTLGRLFELHELKTHLTFKGGTSLSKVYGIIDRFSEDIDLSIERNFWGQEASLDPEKAGSKKKQRLVLDNLAKTCSDYIQQKMIFDLRANIFEKLRTADNWKIEVDAEDPDGQTLLFEYPSIASKGGYIRPIVKIEMGARSEHWPVSNRNIQSYAKDALKEKTFEDRVMVRVLNAERTFWEKATILHQYAHLPEEKDVPPRLSRHYYDFFQLLNSTVKEKALSDISLLERVGIHKSIYFASAWANYGAARKGTLKLAPPTRILEELEKDYTLMEPMFFRAIPEWQLILKTIGEFESEFNS
ncbi:MAG: nucleotidyl transferase AbiEii/AbiGii toxin family protein [Proteobacteria bacterium]|nr:nucleotidyl transferase AbiEii/AbiGii toxin family protein [Pseudomonadota bacterium]